MILLLYDLYLLYKLYVIYTIDKIDNQLIKYVYLQGISTIITYFIDTIVIIIIYIFNLLTTNIY